MYDANRHSHCTLAHISSTSSSRLPAYGNGYVTNCTGVSKKALIAVKWATEYNNVLFFCSQYMCCWWSNFIRFKNADIVSIYCPHILQLFHWNVLTHSLLQIYTQRYCFFRCFYSCKKCAYKVAKKLYKCVFFCRAELSFFSTAHPCKIRSTCRSFWCLNILRKDIC